MTFDELSKIHAELFAETDLNQQIKKFEEEENEFRNAAGTDEDILELADMVIVSAGIARFDYPKGLWYLNWAVDDCCRIDYGTNELWQAVEKKVEKLKKRVWVKDPDVGYKHTKGIED